MPIELYPKRPVEEGPVETMEDAQGMIDRVDGVILVVLGGTAFLALSFISLNIPEDALHIFRIIMLFLFALGALMFNGGISRPPPGPGP